jgi:hypothetical protein
LCSMATAVIWASTVLLPVKRPIGVSSMNGGSTNASSPKTVAEVMVAFVRHARGYYRKHGKPTREFEQIVEACRFIKPLYSRCPATDFGPQALKIVRQAMIDADLSHRFINKQVDRIKRLIS